MNDDTFFNTVIMLTRTSSRIEKLRILKARSDDFIFKEYIRLAYDPFTNFYQKVIPTYAPRAVPTETLTGILLNKLLDPLIYRQVTGNAAKVYLAELLSKLPHNQAEFLKLIILKDLECGVAENTVLEIWPNLFKTFEIMQCSTDLAYIRFPAIAQEKLDGSRCILVNREGNIVAYSKVGRPIEVGGLFQFLLDHLPDGQSIDGELLAVDLQGNLLSRSAGNGIVNKAIKGTISSEEVGQLRYVVYDLPDLGGLYSHRFEKLQELVAKIKSDQISVVKFCKVSSMDAVEQYFSQVLAAGGEGVVLKNLLSLWRSGKSPHIVKLKAVCEADLQVVGYREGTGKAKGKIGSLEVSSSDGQLRCFVGSGLTDLDRDVLTPLNILGKIVRVTYHDVVKAKSARVHKLVLPRLPVNFIRTDKDEADSLSRLIEIRSGVPLRDLEENT